MNEKRIKQIFIKLKHGHPLWTGGDSAYRDRLEKAFDHLFVELETLGVARRFAESLLFFGKEFVDSLEGCNIKRNVPATAEDAELIFGVKAEKVESERKKEFTIQQILI